MEYLVLAGFGYRNERGQQCGDDNKSRDDDEVLVL
jgi:hypothetical protein